VQLGISWRLTGLPLYGASDRFWSITWRCAAWAPEDRRLPLLRPVWHGVLQATPERRKTATATRRTDAQWTLYSASGSVSSRPRRREHRPAAALV